MRSAVLLAAALFVVAVSTPVLAQAPVNAVPVYSPAPAIQDAIPAHATSYDSSEDATRRLSTEIIRSSASGAPLVLRRPSTLGEPQALSQEGEGGRRHKYLPVLFSALVPGAGEMYLGHWKRGVALMAVEVGAWSGYFSKHSQGLDSRDEYEAFADKYWDQRRWIDNHLLVYPVTGTSLEELEDLGRAGSGSGVWPGYNPWVSVEEDKQHYYENVGKYDWYVSGWDDYVPGTTPDDLAPGEVLSRLREEYRDLRGKSNDELDTANRFIYLSIGARVISLVQTTLLVNKSNDETAAADVDNRWMVRARSRGVDSGEVALEYWFK